MINERICIPQIKLHFWVFCCFFSLLCNRQIVMTFFESMSLLNYSRNVLSLLSSNFVVNTIFFSPSNYQSRNWNKIIFFLENEKKEKYFLLLAHFCSSDMAVCGVDKKVSERKFRLDFRRLGSGSNQTFGK